jgi:hypothetical protein
MEPWPHALRETARRQWLQPPYLHEEEARALYEAGYMAPPDMRVLDDWRLSTGVPIPLEPRDNARAAAMIAQYRESSH